MNFFETFQMLGGNVWIYGGTFILVLSILVFVHEWGHYIVARMCGVKVEVFSIGFGRELFGYDDRAGTRWKFSLIPLGGYVKLYGDTDPASAGHTDEVEEGDEKRPMTEDEKKVAFFNKPVWKRALVVFAGPAINYLFAIIIMAGLFYVNGKPATVPSGAAVIEGSSAEKHGFEPHDLIVEIDGKTISSFEDVRREMMIALNTEKHFIVQRDGELIDIYATPELLETEDRFGFTQSRGLLGLVSPSHGINTKNINAINGQSFDSDEAAQAYLADRMGEVVTITLGEGEDAQTLIVEPLAEFNQDFGREGAENAHVLYIGAREESIVVEFSFPGAVGAAFIESYDITVGTLEAIGQMFTGTRSATELGGIIRIGALAGDMAQQGLISLILFTALLSINLGLVNLFPIPMLDGGHLVFYAVEAVIGRPIPEAIQEHAFRFGLVVLIGIMAFANINDIVQLVM